MPLDDIKVYINEILTIEIKAIDLGLSKLKRLDLSHYKPNNSDYETELKRLERKALTEIFFFSNDDIKKHLNHLNQLAKFFYDYWDIAEVWNENYDPEDLNKAWVIDQRLITSFIVPKHPKGIITADFLLDLQWTFSIKYSSLYSLIDQVKNVIQSPQFNEPFDNRKSKDPDLPIAFKYKKYNSNLSAINETLLFLKDKKFVSQNTELTDFRKIFNNSTPNISIQWLSGIEALTYFIKLLHHDFKLIEPIGLNIYKVSANLFVNENNNPFDWKKFSSQKTPSKANLIEMAVDFMK